MITKRMVGVLFVLIGLSVISGTIAVDLVGAGNWSGLGPAQQLGIIVGVILSLIGLSLIPLGDRPA